MKLLLPALLLASSCATTRPQGIPCRTHCGVRVYGDTDCKGIQDKEDEALATLRTVGQLSACDRLWGWVVYVQPWEAITKVPDAAGESPAFRSPVTGRYVKGATYCRAETILLPTGDWQSGSFAHELLHAVECPGINESHTWPSDSWQVQYARQMGVRLQ